MTNVGGVDHVLTASDPLTDATTSDDGRVAYATVQFDGNPGSLGESFVSDVDDAIQPARDKGVHVDYTGSLGQAAEPAPDDRRSEMIGIAVLVLLAAFGSVLAAGLPIVTSAVGVVTGLGLLGLRPATGRREFRGRLGGHLAPVRRSAAFRPPNAQFTRYRRAGRPWAEPGRTEDTGPAVRVSFGTTACRLDPPSVPSSKHGALPC